MSNALTNNEYRKKDKHAYADIGSEALMLEAGLNIRSLAEEVDHTLSQKDLQRGKLGKISVGF